MLLQLLSFSANSWMCSSNFLKLGRPDRAQPLGIRKLNLSLGYRQVADSCRRVRRIIDHTMPVAPHRIWFIRCSARRRTHPIYRTARKRWLANAGLRTAEIVSALGEGIMSSRWPGSTRMRARYRNSIECIQRGELTRNQIADAQRGCTAVTERRVGDYATEFFSSQVLLRYRIRSFCNSKQFLETYFLFNEKKNSYMWDRELLVRFYAISRNLSIFVVDKQIGKIVLRK